jgi:hypothetical protein
MRTFTEEGVELLHYASHAVNEQASQFCYEFELAKVLWDEGGDGSITIYFHDGTIKAYGNPQKGVQRKLWSAVAATLGEGVIVCGPEAAMSHMICIRGMQQSVSEIHRFPEEIIKYSEMRYRNEPGYYVEGLADSLKLCYEKAVLPSEVGFSWAKIG